VSYPTSQILAAKVDNVTDVLAIHVNELQTVGVNMTLRYIKNNSGSTVAANDVGYIDSAGEFKLTTTAYLDGVSWAVVILGGVHTDDIVVAVGGSKITIVLDANCSAGDFLYTSATTKQAKPQSYMRPEMFAIATTANSSGAGGTCEALLHCDTRYVPIASANDIYRVDTHAASDFVSVISGAPTSTSVVYGAVGAGNENVITNVSSSELGKARLYNVTRSNYRLISSVNTGTNTITTIASTDDWADTDAIEIESPTVVSPAAFEYIEIDLSETTVIPELARVLAVDMTNIDSGGTNEITGVHAWKTYLAGSEQGVSVYTVSVPSYRLANVSLYQRRFVYRSSASGAATKTDIFRIVGAWVAKP